jgi:predicted ATPase
VLHATPISNSNFHRLLTNNVMHSRRNTVVWDKVFFDRRLFVHFFRSFD